MSDSRSSSRRDVLKLMGLGLGAALLGPNALSMAAEEVAAEITTVTARKAGAFRVAHLTDIHVQPQRGGGRGMAMCLRHAQSIADKPDLILNTGDSVMDSVKRPEAGVTPLWELWQNVLKDELSLPIHHALGNHDCWGWNRKESRTTGHEPRWGKKWALDVLGLTKSYYAFEAGGWKFLMLDSMQVNDGDVGSFVARLDDEQFAWLESELKSTNPTTPVLVSSHVPIVSPAALLGSGSPITPNGEMLVAGRRTHLDAHRLGKLFAKHPNVKLCISGHLHQIDVAEYRGVTYLCNPAVCGGWWNGKHLGAFGEMYTVLDLMPDGTFEHRYVSYGWKVEPADKS